MSTMPDSRGGALFRLRLAARLAAQFVAACTAGLSTFLILLALVVLAWPAHVPSFASVRAAYVPSDAWLLDRHGAVLASRRLRYDVRRLSWVPLSQVSPALTTAIVDGEDRRFWRHHGVDWRALAGAARDELVHHRRRGASTITMQLATLLREQQFARHARRASAWREGVRKVEQIRLALALERTWTKPQILEAYLNLLGYQGELQGIGAASAQLAGKTPSGLSAPESLLLAALLPRPDASPGLVIARACARGRHLRPVVKCDSLRSTARTLLASHATAGSEAPSERDPLAPHLARALLRTPGERRITSLDSRIQRMTRDIVRSHLDVLADHNVRDGAALVVDNATGEVLAYVGSAGADSSAAEVDGVKAPRQAGSTLKPFLYELALERRYLTAASLLADSPLSLDTASGVYLPQDYAHDFKGLVTVRTALASSLNVPAVRTLVLTGVEAFRDRLHALGYEGIRRDGAYYGYSLALGSAEVTLWQQAQAYRALARDGEWSPLTLTPVTAIPTASAASPPAAHRLLAADATYVVDDILGDPAARTVTFGLGSHLETPFWTGVKTGTSEDMRDNWCIGFSRQFTVAVWVGNFEGDSMHDVSGVSGAAPIWHDIMAALEKGLVSNEPAPPAGVRGEFTQFSPAVEPPRREWYLTGTMAGSTKDSRAKLARIKVSMVPQTARPSIESPANGMIIAIDPDIPAAHQRVLIAVRGASNGMRIRLNDQVLGPALPERLWVPQPGAYYLTLEDRSGQALDRVLFTVRGTPE